MPLSRLATELIPKKRLNSASVSHEKAEEKATTEYNEYNKTQKIESDFDREIVNKIKKMKE